MNKTNSITEIASDVPEMYSIRAGSSICDCENKIDCICLVEIKAENAQNYVYPEVARIPDIYLHDKDGKGVLVELEVVSSGCVSKNDDDCPVATISSDTVRDPKTKMLLASKLARDHKIYKRFKYIDEQKLMLTLGLQQAAAYYQTKSTAYNLGILLNKIFCDEFISIPHNRYTFSVSQCQNSIKQINFLKAISKELTELTDLPSPLFVPLADENQLHTLLIKRSLSWLSRVGRSVSCDIYVFPKYEWSMDIILKYDRHQKKFTENDRKSIAIAHNETKIPKTAAPNYEGKRYSGWTKMPKSGLLEEYTIEGKVNYQVGDFIYSAGTEELQQQFLEVKEQTKILQNTMAVFDTINNCLAPNDGFKILNHSILWPQLSIKIKRELEMVRQNNQVFPSFISTASVSAEPLLGYRLKIDLIQAFATAGGGLAGMEFAREVRKLALKAKENVQNGGNGAYVGAELDLLLSIQGDLALTVKSDASTDYSWRFDFDESARLVGKIVARAAIEAAAKFWFFKGYLDIGGEILAEGMLGFDRSKERKDGLDVVFYHNGIVLKFYVDYGLGEQETQKLSGDVNYRTMSNVVAPTKSGVQLETWVLQEALTKSESPYRKAWN